MFEKQLIEEYLNINENESGGRKRIFSGITKKIIKKILEYQLKDKIGNIDLLSKEKKEELSHVLNEIERISIVEFFQFNQATKQSKIRKIINGLQKINTPESKEIVQKGKKLVEDLNNDVNDEEAIIDFLNQSKDFYKEQFEKNDNKKKKLIEISSQKELVKELSKGHEEIASDTNTFNTISYLTTTKKEAIEIIKNNCAFLSELDKDFTKEYNEFIDAIEGNKFQEAKKILGIREKSSYTQGLYWFYDLTMEYVEYLESNQDKDIEKSKEAVKEMVMEIYKEKDIRLSMNLDRITRQYLHSSEIKAFNNTHTLIKNLISYSKMEKIMSSNKDIVKHLFKNNYIDKLTYLTITKNDYKITHENVENIAKNLFEEIIKKSEEAIEKDEEERTRYERKHKEKGPSKIKKTFESVWKVISKLGNNLLDSLIKLAQTLKGVPKMLLMGIIIIIVTIISLMKGIGSLINSINLGLGSPFGNGNEKNEEDKQKENENHKDGDGGKIFNESFSKLLNKMRSESIKDLINGLFSGDLLAMSGKENSLKHERDLMDRGCDKIRHMEIINYNKLDSKVLVGEIFFSFEETKWKKEHIDHENKHILECNTNKEIKEDYSFFLEQNNWELHLLEDDDNYPTLIIKKGGLTTGINSIVCPRGYVPVLSDEAKAILRNEGIGYELYCIKNFGYYYLKLDKVPNKEILINYVRYGDLDYNGIFFNNVENQGKSGYKDIEERLVSKFVKTEELPENLQKIVDEQYKIQNKKDICEHSTTFLSGNFLYSKYKRNTTDLYRKHESYISGVAQTGIGDCKNINTLNIGLIREQGIQAQECAGYVQSKENEYEGHGVTEVNIDNKCLLLDATPGSKAPEKEKKEKLKKERDNANEKMDLAKSFLADRLGKLKERYKKRMESGKKPQKAIENIVIEKNIARNKGTILSNLEQRSKDFKIILTQHLNNLINKKFIKQLTPEAYKGFLSEYHNRLKNIVILLQCMEEDTENFGWWNRLNDGEAIIISDLSKNQEYQQQLMNKLNYLNQEIGTNLSIDFINDKIIKYSIIKSENKSSNYNIAESIVINEIPQLQKQQNGKYRAICIEAITGWLEKGFDMQMLPYDVSKIINSLGYDDETMSGKMERVETLEMNKNIEHKKDIAPHKVKRMVLGQLESLRINLEKKIYMNTDNEVRTTIMLMLDDIFKKFSNTDDSVWVGRSEKDYTKIQENLSKEENLLKNDKWIDEPTWIKKLPINASYELYLIIGLLNNYGNSEISELISDTDTFKIKHKILANIIGCYSRKGEYNNEIKGEGVFNLLQKYSSINDYKLLNLFLYDIKEKREGYDWNNIEIGGIKIGQKEMLKTIIPSIEKKLLTKYKNNPIATLDLISSKKELHINDYNIIESNVMKISQSESNSGEENIVTEKAIFSVIESILKEDEFDFGGGFNAFLVQERRDNHIGKYHLKDLLSIINPDQIMNISRKVYKKFYEQEKKYRKNKTMAFHERQEKRGELDKVINILRIIWEILGSYNLQKNGGWQTNLLRFKIRQLEKRMGKHVYGKYNYLA